MATITENIVEDTIDELEQLEEVKEAEKHVSKIIVWFEKEEDIVNWEAPSYWEIETISTFGTGGCCVTIKQWR